MELFYIKGEFSLRNAKCEFANTHKGREHAVLSAYFLLQTMHLFPITRHISFLVKELDKKLNNYKKLTFLSLGCVEPGQPVHFEICHFDQVNDQVEIVSKPRLFDPVLGHALYNGNGPVDLPSEILDILGTKKNDPHIVFPLSVYTSPIGFLLLPAHEEIKLQIWSPGVSILLMEALLTEFDEQFSDDMLLSISDAGELCKAFNHALLPWLAPSTHTVSNGIDPGTVQGYFNLWKLNHQTFRITAGGVTPGYYLEYSLPANGSPHVALSPLQRYFNQNLLGRWERVRTPLPDRSVLEAKFDRVSTLIEDLRQDIARIPYTVRAIPTDEQSPAAFSFYLPEGKKDWAIFYKGVQVKIVSGKQPKVGLEAIRIMLQHPDRRFSSLELYDKIKFTKGQRRPSQVDEDENKRRKHELLERWEQLRVALQKEKTPSEIIIIWRLIFELLMVLLEHEPKNRYYLQQYGEAAEKSKIVKEDDNFDRKRFKLYNELKPTGNTHNATTTLQKGIGPAIKLLDHPELRAYLEATLILIRRDRYEPFMYVPGLSKAVAPDWDTGDPVA